MAQLAFKGSRPADGNDRRECAVRTDRGPGKTGKSGIAATTASLSLQQRKQHVPHGATGFARIKSCHAGGFAFRGFLGDKTPAVCFFGNLRLSLP